MHHRVWKVIVLLLALAFPVVARAQPATPVALDPANQVFVYADASGLPDDGLLLGWGSLAHQTGPGIGYQTSYTTAQGFIALPVGQQLILFGDLRAILNNDTLFGANLGGGVRFFAPEADRLFGANVYFDNRDTGVHSFNQVGFGFETLGTAGDLLLNVYLPVGDRRRSTGALFIDPVFIQHNILLSRLAFGQAAMSGFDLEAGAPLPLLGDLGVKGYLGTYHYQVDGTPQAWGASARLEYRPTDGLDLNLTVTEDRVFDTSVMFTAAFRFGAREERSGSSRGDTYARRLDRVHRRENIVVVDQVEQSQELACDPVTLQPIVVQHVNSNSPAGGDGTVERPFQTLAQLQAGSAPNQILFAHANSVFTNQAIVLQNNQRFLGEGLPHIVVACQGTFLLPRATAGTALPLINNAIDNAIILANNDEVSAFVINSAGQSGIRGDGVTGFNINRNTITGNGLNGVTLLQIDGTGRIVGNTLTGNALTGIRLDPINFTGNILNNRASNNGANNNGSGIVIQGATSVTGNIAGNIAEQNGLHGIFVQATTIRGNISNNRANDNGPNNNGNGIEIRDAVTMTGDLSGNTTTGNGLHGIVVNATTLTGNVAGNNASNNGPNSNGNGINLIGVQNLTGNISNNIANTNGLSGIILPLGVSFVGNVTNNVTNGNNVNGLNIQANTLTGNISGNTANNNALVGIFAQADTFNGAVSNNITRNNGLNGISLEVSGTGASNSLINVANNRFENNNSANNFLEFVALHSGNGTLRMNFSGNVTATNPLPPATYQMNNAAQPTASFILFQGAGNVGTVSTINVTPSGVPLN